MKRIDYKTKPDVNGNIKLLSVYPDNSTYEYGYDFRLPSSDDIRITAKTMKQLVDRLEENGYHRI